MESMVLPNYPFMVLECCPRISSVQTLAVQKYYSKVILAANDIYALLKSVSVCTFTKSLFGD